MTVMVVMTARRMTSMFSARARGVDRFSVIRKIGEGATSCVYEVLDRQSGGRFALKRLGNVRLSPDRLARFKDEFRALERLSHPNLAKVYELIANEHETCLLMELVEGTDFLSYVRRGATSGQLHETGSTERADMERTGSSAFGVLCVQRLRSSLVQLVLGLRALHAAGKIHCDVKAENVLVRDDGRLAIVDFGLVTEAVRDDHWRGTPAFMAPEQFDGVFAESVDWYAVGVLLYAALAGRYPTNSSGDATALMRRFTKPIDPRVFVPDLPERLVELALGLLEPLPQKRLTGEQVARRLGLVPRAEPAPRLATFVGRKVELARLASALSAVLGGATGVVHIHGESGIGKTALISQFARDAEERGAIVLRGACYRDASVAYKGLDQLIDRLAAGIGPLEIELSTSDRAALGTMFPVFQMGRLKEQEAELDGSSTMARAHGMDALRRLLQRIAAPQGLVLCIDDVQWSDRESIEVLAELVQGAALPGVLLVLGYRSKQAGLGERARDARKLLPMDDELRLGPLDAAALQTIVAASGPLGAIDLAALFRESSGNPFLIGELLRAGRSATAEPVSVESAISRRLERLLPLQRRYLELVAVAGEPIDERILRDALAVSHEEALATRCILLSESFVRIEEHESYALEPYHDRIREYVLQQLVPSDLRARHEALALIFEAAEPRDPEVLAQHYGAAANRLKALHYGELAGDAAARALAFDHAAKLYEAALALADAEHATAIRAKLARALSNAGRPAEAAQVFRALLEERPMDLDLLLCVGDELLKSGEIEQGLTYLGRVADELGHSIPKSRFVAVIKLMWNWLRLRGTPIEIREEPLTDEARRSLTFCIIITRQLLVLDYVRSVLFSFRHLRLAYERGARTDIIEGLMHEATFVSAGPTWLGGVAEAERLVATAHTLRRDSDPAVTRGVLRFGEGAVAFAHGRWRAARVAFDDALETLRDKAVMRRHWNIAFCQCGIVENLRMEGDIREMRQRLLLFRPEAKGHRTLEAVHRLRGGVLVALADDDPAKAREILRETITDWPSGSSVVHYYAAFDRVEIALYEGDAASAWRGLDGAWKAFAAMGLHRNSYYSLVQLVLEIRASLAFGARRTAARGLRKLLARTEPWARAVGMALKGCMEAQRGHLSEAVGLLTEAAPLVEGAELTLCAAATRHRLALLTGDGSAERCAHAALSRYGVKAPERMTSYLLPCP